MVHDTSHMANYNDICDKCDTCHNRDSHDMCHTVTQCDTYGNKIVKRTKIGQLGNTIGHEGFVGLSVCKVYISATRWRLFT
jgi:hypothetical protein